MTKTEDDFTWPRVIALGAKTVCMCLLFKVAAAAEAIRRPAMRKAVRLLGELNAEPGLMEAAKMDAEKAAV